MCGWGQACPEAWCTNEWGQACTEAWCTDEWVIRVRGLHSPTLSRGLLISRARWATTTPPPPPPPPPPPLPYNLRTRMHEATACACVHTLLRCGLAARVALLRLAAHTPWLHPAHRVMPTRSAPVLPKQNASLPWLCPTSLLSKGTLCFYAPSPAAFWAPCAGHPAMHTAVHVHMLRLQHGSPWSIATGTVRRRDACSRCCTTSRRSR